MGSDLLADKYLLLKRLAEGGMAEIFLAKRIGLDGFEKLVVIKKVLPKFADKAEYLRMFLDEAKTAADLRHPNIVSTFEVDKDQGTYFMVMEYLQGLDLRYIYRNLKTNKEKLPLELAVGIVMEACAGLQYAHNKSDLNGRPLGIVHRDISPQNIVLTFDGETKIVDFGIAKALHLHEDSKRKFLKGKFAYMSFEQANGLNLDHRSDQFSLAVVLYELTTMQRLFKRKSQEESLKASAECKIERPSLRILDFPIALESIIMKALSKAACDRFADCASFRNALDGFLQDNGLAFNRDKLSSYLSQKFKDLHESKSDFAGTYLVRQTQSESVAQSQLHGNVAKARSFLSYAVVATLLITMSFGLAFFYFSQSFQGQVNSQILVESISSVDESQSLGTPEIAEAKIVAAEKTYGRLKIVVEPWGEIFVDEKRLGLTPLAPQTIVAGKHDVRISNPRLAKEKTIRVVIRADQDTLVRHTF